METSIHLNAALQNNLELKRMGRRPPRVMHFIVRQFQYILHTFLGLVCFSFRADCLHIRVSFFSWPDYQQLNIKLRYRCTYFRPYISALSLTSLVSILKLRYWQLLFVLKLWSLIFIRNENKQNALCCYIACFAKCSFYLADCYYLFFRLHTTY